MPWLGQEKRPVGVPAGGCFVMDEETRKELDALRAALLEDNRAIRTMIDAINLLNCNDQALLANIVKLAEEQGIQLDTRIVRH